MGKNHNPEVRLHIADMKVVKSPRLKEPFYMKTAYAIGYAAYYVHTFIKSWFFRIAFVLAVIYAVMRVAGISIVIMRAGDVLLMIK